MRIRITGKTGATTSGMTWTAKGLYWHMSRGGRSAVYETDELTAMSPDARDWVTRIAITELMDEGFAESAA